MKTIFLFFLSFVCINLVAQQKIAIVEPSATGISKSQVEIVWTALETGVNKDYTVISRSALKPILEEITFVENSGLVELDSDDRAKLGEVHSVSALLITKIHLEKSTNKLFISAYVIDASTGKIDNDKKRTAMFNNFEELMTGLNGLLSEMNLATAEKLSNRVALLNPIFVGRKPLKEVAVNLNSTLEEKLISNEVKLYNLKDISEILKKNKIDEIETIRPEEYSRVGKLLKADILLQPIIMKLEIEKTERYVEVLRRNIVKKNGRFDATIKLVDVKNGEIKGQIPIRIIFDFSDLPLNVEVEDWAQDDYYNWLIKLGVEKALPKILTDLKK